MTKEDLDYWLVRFALEVREKDAKEFPTNSLHRLCCGILRHLRASGASIAPTKQFRMHSGLGSEQIPILWFGINTGRLSLLLIDVAHEGSVGAMAPHFFGQRMWEWAIVTPTSWTLVPD